jgi:UTP--glucose-1-phosphate uridylyltransferase
MSITKAIIPAAGYGTRFLPITKVIPKELLPLGNKPALQLVIEEGKAAGITDFYLVINKEKEAIKHYFAPTRSPLANHPALHSLDEIIRTTSFHYLMQPVMKGLGDAIATARTVISDPYFGVILPDDVMFGPVPALEQLMRIALEYSATVVAVREIPGHEISAYGSIKPGAYLRKDIVEITDIIEKPAPGKAFSPLGIIGRYIFTPAIFDAIAAITPHAHGEVQLTDAITHLARTGHRVLAYTIQGERCDIGRPTGWLDATLRYALQSPELHPTTTALIKQLAATLDTNQ